MHSGGPRAVIDFPQTAEEEKLQVPRVAFLTAISSSRQITVAIDISSAAEVLSKQRTLCSLPTVFEYVQLALVKSAESSWEYNESSC